ncbi:MAG: MFS transporter [Gammaproteobacteria bacterium]|nr:MFS transporter [Gammaproteobacteria bacterium]
MAQRPLELNPLYWYYGTAAISFGIKNHAFSYLLLIFATQAMGIPGWQASLALAIAMIWDAVSDLLLGHWSDKTRSRLGRRHPFMYAALVILPISFWCLFNPPAVVFDENLKFAYILVFSILIRTGTTLFEVPSLAQLPELEKDYHRRSRWLSLRHLLMWYGGNGIHTVNLFFWVGAFGIAELTGYAIYAYWGAGLIALSIIVSSLGTQSFGKEQAKPTEMFQLKAIFRELMQIYESLKNKNLAALFFYGLINGAAGGLGAALFLYTTRYFFGFNEKQIGIIGLMVFLAPLITYLVVPFFGRFGQKKTTAIAILLALIAIYPLPYVFYLVGFWPDAKFWQIGIFGAVIIFEVVCMMCAAILMDSMMADVVEDSEVNTMRRSEGLFFAARGFGSKAISSLGIVFAGVIVSVVGMESFRSELDMTDSHRLELAAYFLPIWCGLQLLAVTSLSLYKIHKGSHEENLATIEQRKLGSAIEIGS